MINIEFFTLQSKKENTKCFQYINKFVKIRTYSPGRILTTPGDRTNMRVSRLWSLPSSAASQRQVAS